MARLLILSLAVIFTVMAASSARRPGGFNFNSKPEPPRVRFEPSGSVGGNGRRNYNANVGGRVEYDIHRFKNGAKVVGTAEGSKNFGRYDGHTYKEKPKGEVGVRVEVPFR